MSNKRQRDIRGNNGQGKTKYQCAVPVDIAKRIDKDATAQCRSFNQQLEFILREKYFSCGGES
jgi:hypothetical protein